MVVGAGICTPDVSSEETRGGRDHHQGICADGTRLDKLDTSAHSASLGWLQGNFSLVLQHIWQLERADDQDNTIVRLTAAYEFRP